MQLGGFAVLALIALRLGIGWHFFDDGLEKVLSGNFSSADFFWQAKGPLAKNFKLLLPDMQAHQWLDRDAAERRWQAYREEIASHFEFNESQEERADAILNRHLKLLGKYFVDYEIEITLYLKSREALEEKKKDPMTVALPSFAKHVERNEQETSQLPGGLVAPVQEFWRSLESQLNGIRGEEQSRQDDFPILTKGGWLSIETVDRFIPWFVLTVGTMLLIGLFTRRAALSGAGFLFMVMANQPPWISGPIPIHSELIEALGLIVLAGTRAGRFAGLDFFFDLLFRWR